MAESPHNPGALIFQNTVTGQVQTGIRFGSKRHHALIAQRHPTRSHEQLWQQVHTPQRPEGGETDD